MRNKLKIKEDSKVLTIRYESKHILSFILLISFSFFILGLLYPILTTKQQVLGIVLKFQEVKLFDSVLMFYKENDYLLASIILLFTIILPVMKFIAIFNKLFDYFELPEKVDYILHLLDKWSMLDVFLVALLLLNYKLNSYVLFMELGVGTWFIALSILFRMFTSMLMDYKIKKI